VGEFEVETEVVVTRRRGAVYKKKERESRNGVKKGGR